MKKHSKLFSVVGFLVTLAVVTGFVFITQNVDRGKNDEISKERMKEIKSSNSRMVEYVDLSYAADIPRDGKIKKITIHHTGGILSLEEIGNIFSDRDRKSSTNYAIDMEGRVGLYVEEKNRAWSSDSKENDNVAVTIEVCNDKVSPEWHVGFKTYNALIDLCTDICKRNGIKKLNYTGDASGNLTMHCMFDSTECPGPYLKSRMGEIAKDVNRNLRRSDAHEGKVKDN